MKQYGLISGDKYTLSPFDTVNFPRSDYLIITPNDAIFGMDERMKCQDCEESFYLQCDAEKHMMQTGHVVV